LLSGYYGFGNFGDDALLKVIVRELRTRHPYARIEVLSQEPEMTSHDLGIFATPRADLGAVRAAIERSDIVLSGGGGLLQNSTSMRSLLYYAGILRTAIHARKRAMIFAQSIGPLDFWGKQAVKECCRGLTAATVRDERSRVLLRSLLGGVSIERTADPVFLYDLPEGSAPPSGLSGGTPSVVVCPRKTSWQPELVERMAEAVDRLCERHGARAMFVSFGGPSDADVATLIIRKCRTKPMLVPVESFDAAAAIIAAADLVIGVRLHALILAARLGVPFLAVPYDPKVAALSEDLAYPLPPFWVPGERSRAEDGLLLLDRAWNERTTLAAHLRSKLPGIQALARANFEVLDGILPS
jgi:polysaccharide pyruvyl transferase CsaB